MSVPEDLLTHPGELAARFTAGNPRLAPAMY